LEEFLDLGILYCGEQRRLLTSGSHRCRLMVQMAERLGFPALAAQLTQAFEETAAASLPPELRPTAGHESSFLLLPLSSQRLKEALASRLTALQNPRSPQAHASPQEKDPRSIP
jgi:hypothetical protein